MNQTVLIYLYAHPLGKGVYNRRADSVKSAACLVRIIIKFAACMKGGQYDSLRGHALLMHLHRDSASRISYGTGTIRFQCNPDLITEACQMLVHCVIHDLINQVVKSLCADAAYIHTRSLPDCLKTFQN